MFRELLHKLFFTCFLKCYLCVIHYLCRKKASKVKENNNWAYYQEKRTFNNTPNLLLSHTIKNKDFWSIFWNNRDHRVSTLSTIVHILLRYSIPPMQALIKNTTKLSSSLRLFPPSVVCVPLGFIPFIVPRSVSLRLQRVSFATETRMERLNTESLSNLLSTVYVSVIWNKLSFISLITTFFTRFTTFPMTSLSLMSNLYLLLLSSAK